MKNGLWLRNKEIRMGKECFWRDIVHGGNSVWRNIDNNYAVCGT